MLMKNLKNIVILWLFFSKFKITYYTNHYYFFCGSKIITQNVAFPLKIYGKQIIMIKTLITYSLRLGNKTQMVSTVFSVNFLSFMS